MLVREGRAAATAWVVEHAAAGPGFRGAFFTGSAAVPPYDRPLPATSDVDLVVAGSKAPPKLGKFVHRGVLLEVTYLASADLASAREVVASYVLARASAPTR